MTRPIWLFIALASTMSFAGPGLARPIDLAVCSNGAGRAASPMVMPAASPACPPLATDGARASAQILFGTESALCAVLLGCMLVAGGQASRRKTSRIVLS